MLGWNAIGETALAELPDALRFGQQTTTHRWASTSFATRSTDTPAHEFISGRVLSSLRVDRQIPTVDGGAYGALLSSAVGELELANNDRALDGIEDDWFADGRPIRFYLGRMAQDPYGHDVVDPYANFTLTYTAVAGAWSFGLDVVNLRVRDQGIILQQRLQPTTYSGAGGENGTPPMAGRSLPVALGRLLNVPAQEVDPAVFTYQVHDGRVAAILVVRDAGVDLTFSADFVDYASLVAATIPAGQYATCLASGHLRLGSAPVGVVTADVDGDATGSGFVNTHGDVIRRILERYSSLLTAQIDETSFTNFATTQPAPMGLFLPAGDESTLEEAILRVALSGGAVVGQDRSGLYRIFQLVAPTSTAAYAFDESSLIEIDRVRLPYSIPWESWSLGYARNWRVMTGGDLSTSVTDGFRQFAEAESRYSRIQLTDVALAHPTAGSMVREGLYDKQADADVEVGRLAALYALGRRLYRIVVKRVLFQVAIGEIVRLTYPAWDLQGGRTFVVVAAIDDVDTQATEMVVFG